MPAWPVTLPTAPLAASFRPVYPDLVKRTPVDGGAAYQRPTATAGPTRFPGLQFPVTATQAATFRTFWTDDIGDGASSFDFDVPADWPVDGAGTTRTFRITSVYQLIPRSRGIRWTLQVDMEMVP